MPFYHCGITQGQGNGAYLILGYEFPQAWAKDTILFICEGISLENYKAGKYTKPHILEVYRTLGRVQKNNIQYSMRIKSMRGQLGLLWHWGVGWGTSTKDKKSLMNLCWNHYFLHGLPRLPLCWQLFLQKFHNMIKPVSQLPPRVVECSYEKEP
jgi:hypothetical protein